MIKIVFTSILIFWGFISLAQNEENSKQSRFSFGVSFSPDYTYRNFRTGDEKLDNIVGDMDDIESPRFGFTTGLACKYQFSRRFALESGILFSDKGDKVEMSNEYWISPDDLIDPGFTGPDPAIPNELKMKYHHYYIGIPLKVNYFLVDKKLKVFLSGGFSTDFYINTTVKSVYTLEGEEHKDTSHPEDDDFKKVNFVGLAGVGIEYPISSNFSLRFEPIYRYSFTQMVEEGAIDLDTHLYSIGVNFAIYFQK